MQLNFQSSNTMMVNIDGAWHEVPDAVANRMQEYYDTMKAAVVKLDALEPAVKHLRRMQISYFKARPMSPEKAALLIRAKEAETEVDNILAGNTQKEQVRQSELFR